MKVLLDIPDSQASFGMQVLKSLSFVKKVNPISKASARLWDSLCDSAEEVRLHKQGIVKLKTAQDLLNEL